MKLQTGFSPGQYSRAASEFTMTTGGESASSRSENGRPRSSGVPLVLKKSALIQQPCVGGAWSGSLARSENRRVAVAASLPGVQSASAAALTPGSAETPARTSLQKGRPSGV